MDLLCVGRHGLLTMRKLIAIAFLFATSQAWAAFGYYSPISINAAQVPSTQTDFPVLVSVTDARFKTVANGGHVQNSSGFDIRPYTDSTLVTAITGYELERYNASSGEVVMWVKVSSLSSSTTPFVLAYGDSGISTDGSSTTTWSNGYLGVYHLKDGTTLNVNSATGSNNGTNHSATATTGQIDGGAAFVSASSQYIDLSTGMNPVGITMSAWVKGTSFPNAYNSVVVRDSASNGFASIFVKSNGKLGIFVADSGGTTISYDGTGSNTLSTGTWYYLTLTFTGGGSVGLNGYVNASSDHAAIGSSLGLHVGAANTDIGRDNVNAGRFWNGAIDEVRISGDNSSATIGVRSQDWITTEYNNQFAPGTFETLGTEVPLGVTTKQRRTLGPRVGSRQYYAN